MKKKYLFAILMLVMISTPFFAFAAQSDWWPLVTCGVSNPVTGQSTAMCTLCDLYVLAQRIMYFLMWQATPIIAIFAFSWAGFKILISGPNPGLRSEGFGIMKKTLVGMLIVFSSWIIINEVLLFFSGASSSNNAIGGVLSNPWNQVNCALRPSAAVLAPGVTMGPAYDGPGAADTQTLPRLTLATQGINAKDNYCQDFAPPNQTTACTTLVQLPQNAIDGLISLKNNCNCTIFVTGGTEVIGHSSHGPGRPNVDVSIDPTLSNYIYAQAGGNTNFTSTRLGPRYTGSNGVTYLQESAPAHWHIEF